MPVSLQFRFTFRRLTSSRSFAWVFERAHPVGVALIGFMLALLMVMQVAVPYAVAQTAPDEQSERTDEPDSQAPGDESGDAGELDDEADASGDEDEEVEEEEALGATPEIDLDWSEVEEIEVIGQAGQGIQVDAAESAVMFDSQDLEAMGAGDVTDIAKITPNLEIRQADATTANFFIRGVGLADFSANSASAVAVYNDGVPLNSSAIQLVGLFDVQGVEVLRGPQGSGSGRNATAGAIKIDSRLPTGELGAQLRSSFGTYVSDDALSDKLLMDYEGAVEVPILEDLLSSRLSFRVRTGDPYITNGYYSFDDYRPPQAQLPKLPGRATEVGDKGEWAARAIFRYQPQALDMDWVLNIHGGRLDQQSTLGQAMGTLPTLGRSTDNDNSSNNYFEPDQREEFQYYFQELGMPRQEALDLLARNLASQRPLDTAPYRGDYNRTGQTTRDSVGASLRGSMLFEEVPLLGPVTLETISAYDQYDRFRDTDQDFTPLVLFERKGDDSAWQFFQELKATGENDMGTLRWELGGYYLMEELGSEFEQYTINPQFDFHRTFDQDLWSFALYAGFGWDFLDDFTLDAGIRYNWERKTFSFEQVQLSGADSDIATPQDETWSAPTGLISLRYRFNDQVAAYVKYARGWKGGHFNANRPNLPDENEPVNPVRPETLDSIEVGYRGSWLDSRVFMSGAFFYYKYKDYQLFLFENAQIGPPILEIVNANDVESYGVELELTARPLEDLGWVPSELGGLELTTRFGWLESHFLDFVNLIERMDPSTFTRFNEVVNYTGNRLPNAPEFKISLGVNWPFELGGFGTLTPRYDLDWTDDVFFGPGEGKGTSTLPGEQLPDLTIGQGAFARHNLRLSYVTPDGLIEISGWVRNVGDARYKTYAFDASLFANVVVNFVGEPRTGGADITIRF